MSYRKFHFAVQIQNNKSEALKFLDQVEYPGKLDLSSNQISEIEGGAFQGRPISYNQNSN